MISIQMNAKGFVSVDDFVAAIEDYKKYKAEVPSYRFGQHFINVLVDIEGNAVHDPDLFYMEEDAKAFESASFKYLEW